MASFKEHGNDCERLLGSRYPQVHAWLDEMFRIFGPDHRFKRHHLEGAKEAGDRFGAGAEKAALIHILKDCGHIPKRRDYTRDVRAVDLLGMKEDFNGYWDPQTFDSKAKEILKSL